jgi:hypothetical protein
MKRIWQIRTVGKKKRPGGPEKTATQGNKSGVPKKI